jgi:hypothetical protein
VATLAAALLCAPAGAQTAPPLRIVAVEGEEAIHNIRRKAVSPVVVEIRDERNRPVADARTRFTLPEIGPGGRFADGSRTQVTFTDAQGRAAMPGFAPNDHEGRFTVVVSANSGGRESSMALTQRNVLFPLSKHTVASPKPRSASSKRILALVGIGAVAAAVSLMAVRGARPAPAVPVPPATIGIVGGISVGGPR